jgi:hypothetical protein
MYPSLKRIPFLLLAIVIVLAACAPAPTVAPTQDPALVQQLIEQSVALTLAAQNAQATEQQALIVPSNTPLPTQTEAVPATPTPVLPTATPFVIIPPTSTVVVSSGGGGGGGSGNPAVQADYSCSVIARSPADYTVFKPGEDFDIKWTIVNTGKKNIRDGSDVKYSSGENFALQRFVELPLLKPGERHQVVVDAEAPAKLGRYIMVWVVEGQLCFPYVAIEVKK